MASRAPSILSRKEDIHCVTYHLLCLVAYGAAFWLYLHPEVAGIEGPWSRLAFVLGSAVMLGWISGVDVGVSVPGNSRAEVLVPSPSGDQVFLDGRSVPATREGEYLVIQDVPSGCHLLSTSSGESPEVERLRAVC